MKGKTRFSCKIDVNYSRLRSVRYLEDLAYIFFPNKDAGRKREAFIKIWMEIRDSRDQKADRLEHLFDEYVTQSILWKVRKEMRSIGLIDYKGYKWQFSTKFANSLRKLAETVEDFMEPVTAEQQKRDILLFRHLQSKRSIK